MNSINDFLFVTDNEGNIKQAFGKKIKKINTDLESIIESNIEKIFPQTEADIFLEKFSAAVNERNFKSFEIDLEIDDKINYYSCRIEPLQNKRGQVQFVFIFLNDITNQIIEKKKLEGQLTSIKTGEHF